MTEALRSLSITDLSSLLWPRPTSGAGEVSLLPCFPDLPCSLSKPVRGSCCLYNGGRTASNSGGRCACPYLLCKRRFCPTTKRFRYFIGCSLSFISPILTCLLTKGFSLTVHHHLLTEPAAQSGLTTPPVQRCQSAGRSPPSSLSLKELAWHKQRSKVFLCIFARVFFASLREK